MLITVIFPNNKINKTQRFLWLFFQEFFKDKFLSFSDDSSRYFSRNAFKYLSLDSLRNSSKSFPEIFIIIFARNSFKGFYEDFSGYLCWTIPWFSSNLLSGSKSSRNSSSDTHNYYGYFSNGFLQRCWLEVLQEFLQEFVENTFFKIVSSIHPLIF